MDKNRLWVIGAVVVMVVIAALGWVVGVQPQLDAAAASEAQRVTVEATNATNLQKLAALKHDYANLPDLKQQLARLNKSVPTDGEMPALVTELNALAAAHGVTLVGITVSDAQAYTPVVAPAVQAPAPAAGSTPSPTPSPAPGVGPTSTPAPSAPVAGVPPVTNALITQDNFAAIPVGVNVTGPYANVLGFVKGIQTGDRLFLVTSLSTTTSPTVSGVDGKISGLIYVLVQPTAPAATK